MQSNIFNNFIERIVGSSCEVRSPPKECAAQRAVEGWGRKEKKNSPYLYDDLLGDSEDH